jgi:broad specificity phosphatase PhoE
VLLIRHAEPLVVENTPATDRPLTERGRDDAIALGASLGGRSPSSTVWTSSERRAGETAALVFPQTEAVVRDQHSEVKKPWYASDDEHASEVANYLKDDVIEGWERREDVVARIARLKSGFGCLENLALVSHGLLITTWLDDEIGLDDPLWFWSNLRMPDAWELDVDDKALQRIG